MFCCRIDGVTGAEYELSPDAIATKVGDEAVVWLSGSGLMHLLDPSAAHVLLSLLQYAATAESVAARLSDVFDAPVTHVLDDVQFLLNSLVAKGVLVVRAT